MGAVRRKTDNDDTGSLYTGRVKLEVGDVIAIEGEGRLRRVTYVMGSDAKGWRACFKGQGALPTGTVRWRAASRSAVGVPPPMPRSQGSAPRASVGWAPMPLALTGPPGPVIVTGFDSAWTRTNLGAIVSFVVEGGRARMVAGPRAAGFDEAAELIVAVERAFADSAQHVVVVDEPLVVGNESGCRPVERALSRVMGRRGGGVQPANRGRREMFGEGAPIWDFLGRISGSLDPWSAGDPPPRRMVIESYPALALLGLFPQLEGRGVVARYNPARRATFARSDWVSVCASVGAVVGDLGAETAASWCRDAAARPAPRKSDQDALDALICALVGILRCAAPSALVVIGDLEHGYVVTPATIALEHEVREAGRRDAVAVAVARLPRAPGEGDRGSPAAVLAAMRRHTSASDVDDLMRAIEAGRGRAQYGSPLR